MKFKARRELKRTKIEIIPMIDTMFFLLVFFMLSSLALTRINGLKVNLPKTATLQQEPATNLTLTITKDQKLFLNKLEVEKDNLLPALQQELNAQHADLNSTTFVINADESVPHGLVIRSIDESRLAGITHFAIATSPVSAP
jgi:biopolymer transport protein ExbD